MTIRQARPEDIPRLRELADCFCAATQFLKRFQFERFCSSWITLSGGPGVMLIAESDFRLDGCLGGVAYPDPNTWEMVASEFCWFVHPERRGAGPRLYAAFEEWAKAAECTEIRMVALADSMPEALDKFYRRKGFTLTEFVYSKDLM